MMTWMITQKKRKQTERNNLENDYLGVFKILNTPNGREGCCQRLVTNLQWDVYYLGVCKAQWSLNISRHNFNVNKYTVCLLTLNEWGCICLQLDTKIQQWAYTTSANLMPIHKLLIFIFSIYNPDSSNAPSQPQFNAHSQATYFQHIQAQLI